MQHEFSNHGLLTQALTHRSFSSDHYERLEFLGDSVLNLAVSDLQYYVGEYGLDIRVAALLAGRRALHSRDPGG